MAGSFLTYVGLKSCEKVTFGFLQQVKLLSFHPTQPWLAYADRGQDLTVLDWETQQVHFCKLSMQTPRWISLHKSSEEE